VEFPPKHSRAVTIFWASWCGPCKIEMQRLKSSVENKKISPDLVFAINPFETHSEVITFLKQNKFPFKFIEAPDITEKLNIISTPTTMFLNQGVITSLSSGVSFIGIWKAEYFL
jgi:thiol-disulfide isomerase/thioredoxin